MPIKIATIALQKSLSTDYTALGHSYSKNYLCLESRTFGIGVTCKAVYKNPIFKDKLSKCSNVNDVCTLLAENSNYSTLLKGHVNQPSNC